MFVLVSSIGNATLLVCKSVLTYVLFEKYSVSIVVNFSSAPWFVNCSKVRQNF